MERFGTAKAVPLRTSSGIGDAVAEEAESREFFDVPDLRGDENGGLAGRIWNSNFDRRAFCVLFAAAKAEPAFGHVVALDDFFVRVIHADASGETYSRADMAAAIGLSAAGKCGKRSGF